MTKPKQPKNNLVYYPVGTKILWRNKPGIVVRLCLKPINYPVGYDVLLNDGEEILNVHYFELSLQSGENPCLYSVNPKDELWRREQSRKLYGNSSEMSGPEFFSMEETEDYCCLIK